MFAKTFNPVNFHQIYEYIEDLPIADKAFIEKAKIKQSNLTKPIGSLGRLEDLAVFVSGWQATDTPNVKNVEAIIFAGNHGICNQGVNPFPQEVTCQMVENFRNNGAAINQICESNGIKLKVVDLELERPTQDFSGDLALTEQETLDAFNAGWNAVNKDAQVLILGEMGIGNSTVASAICSAIFGGSVESWVGPGTGADTAGVEKKIRVIENSLEKHKDELNSPLEILSVFGGREQAAICGAILGARANRKVVILDGFICCASASILHAIDEKALDHCLLGHLSAEPASRSLASLLGKKPILDLAMRLGEGSGAALSFSILKAAISCHNGMASFAEAGVDTS